MNSFNARALKCVVCCFLVGASIFLSSACDPDHVSSARDLGEMVPCAELKSFSASGLKSGGGRGASVPGIGNPPFY